ncbi:MAG TPA: hypothetical protein VII75_06450 [Thermoanaerobaculia bacterium]|nr:hypothetical protein [Thermoanaerobaculia bacterium]
MESKYDELLARDVASVKHRFAAFTPQLKTDLWLLQLERYLAEHPELTAGQRAVIFQAVGLLYSGIMDVSPSDAQWDSRVNQPLLRLMLMAKPHLIRSHTSSYFSAWGRCSSRRR